MPSLTTGPFTFAFGPCNTAPRELLDGEMPVDASWSSATKSFGLNLTILHLEACIRDLPQGEAVFCD